MRRCASCSAPLAAHSNVCRYCGVRNDIDLAGRFEYAATGKIQHRLCPCCQIVLQGLQISLPTRLTIERCPECLGLFFDRGEIEILLEHAVMPPTAIDRVLLDTIARERYQTPQFIFYLPCPVCSVLMNRVNYGQRSGVVVDVCFAHGLWLDSGELAQLLEWKRAGGQLLDRHRREIATRRAPHPRDPPVADDQDTATWTEWSEALGGILSTLADNLFR